MEEAQKKFSLKQAGSAEDHAAKIMREKIGDVQSLGEPPVEETVVEGADSPDQRQLVQKIIAVLRTIFDPEIPLNIYELGPCIYRIAISPANAVKLGHDPHSPRLPRGR